MWVRFPPGTPISFRDYSGCQRRERRFAIQRNAAQGVVQDCPSPLFDELWIALARDIKWGDGALLVKPLSDVGSTALTRHLRLGARRLMLVATQMSKTAVLTKGRIYIEYVQNRVPFRESDEYVVIFNGSKKKYDLKGWRLVYEDLATKKVLHTHYFDKLDGSFDPGERLCVISDEGEDEFVERKIEDEFPGKHWDLYTDVPRHLMDVARLRVSLFDEMGNPLSSMSVERLGTEGRTPSAITVFIGHGADRQWRDLKDHLQDQHKIKVIAYEISPRAGLSVKEVLEKMLSESSFAILVLTGEDIHSDGELHARENVVHECGLFQGHLGFTKAIVLLEQGVKEFSNILGINQIRFPKGGIRQTFGDVVATIRREF